MKYHPAGQENLSRRLAQLRARKKWTAGDVQRELAKVGCDVPRNAALRIEQGTRQVTVDELVAFSKVYGKTVEDLMTPVELVGHETAKGIAARIDREMAVALESLQRLGEALNALRELRKGEPEAGDYLVRILAEPYLAAPAPAHEASELRQRMTVVGAEAIGNAWHAVFRGDEAQPFGFIETPTGSVVLHPERPFRTETERRAAERAREERYRNGQR